MAYTAAHWTIDRQTGNIRYTGPDHDEASPSYATVIEAHREWADLADNASSAGNDDELDITDNTPSDRSTDNIITLNPPFNIDDAASEHLYDGSIIQNGGDDIYDGIVNFGNASVQIQIMQNGAIIADDWWNKSTPTADPVHQTGANVATLDDGSESYTTNQYVGYTIYNTTDGSQGLITANTGTTVTAVLYGGTDDDWDISDAYLFGVPLNGSAAAGISHRFMIKTRSDGADIDGRRLIGIARRFGNTYSEFKINGSSRGNNVLALSDATDLNNASNPQTVDTWNAFANDSVGFDASQDVDNDTTNEEYYSRWDITAGTPSSPTINQLYEWGKWITTQGTALSMYGISGELFRGITLQILYDGLTSTFDESEYLVWGTNVLWDTPLTTRGTVGAFYTFSPSGAVGQLLANDDDTTAGNSIFAIESGTVADNDLVTRSDGTTDDGFTVNTTPIDVSATGGVGVILADDGNDTVWIQLLKGGTPVDNLPMWETSTVGVFDADISAGYALVNTTPTDREPLITKPFIGASTGSSIIGGYGIGIDLGDLTSSDILFDLDNAQITPPNTVTVSIGGLVSGEDYLTVNQRGYRFAYDNENNGPFVVGETLTGTGNTDGTYVIAEIVDKGTTGYIIISEAVTGDIPIDNTAIAVGGGADAIVNGTVSSDINKRQMETTVLLNATPETSVTVTPAIPTDTPSSGIIRVQDDNGFYRRLIYSSYTGSVFTITNSGTEDDFSGDIASIGKNVYIGYIDLLSTTSPETFQGVFLANRNLFVRVRDGGTAGDNQGIKTFETTVAMTTSGGSATVIRTSDE